MLPLISTLGLLDLARRVAPGPVLGIDFAPDIVAEARASGLRGGAENVRFAVGDVYALDQPDESFDVAHAHQVLQHLSDPVAALAEMWRVLEPGGLLAVRDSDYAAFAWAPRDARLDRWMELYHQVTARNGAEADAGCFLLRWARAAGFAEVAASSSTWTFADASSRQWWGGLWADRVEQSAFAEQALAYGLADREELADLAEAWRAWAGIDDALFIVVHGEVLARRPTGG